VTPIERAAPILFILKSSLLFILEFNFLFIFYPPTYPPKDLPNELPKDLLNEKGGHGKIARKNRIGGGG
jgi:hypothetical protein